MADRVPAECDVAIVGGGPAGLAAAVELRAAGVRSVVVLDREPEAGGIPRHCGHYPFGMREFARLLRGPDYARRLVARARAAGVGICTGVTVTALRAGGWLDLSTPDGLVRVQAARVLLATGVRESSRAARLIGGTRPGGILSTGALQGLVYLKDRRPFERPLVLGTELVSFSALLTCRHAGIRPVAMVEPGPRPTARWPAGLLPRLLGIPLHLGTELLAIHGTARVSGAVLRGPDGAERHVACDGVIVSGGFVPEATLVRASHLALNAATGGPEVDQFGRCSDPVFFAAGNLTRPVETAGWSWAEGRRTGRAIALSLQGALPPAEPALRLRAAGEALKYALPQRITPTDTADPAIPVVQLRLTRPVRGRIVLSRDGAEIWTRPLTSRPERRLTLPLSVLPPEAHGTIDIRIEEGRE